MALVFPILTEFNDKGAKKADTAFAKLGKRFAAAFSVATVVKFTKASVQAFAEAEKEAALLRSQLEAINLSFAAPLLDDYIDRLELLSGRTGRDLTFAFNSLSQATNDVTTAQNLLNTALDISAATGKSLQTVTTALQRAYKGETTALARLRIGYTTASLKGKDFDEVLVDLQERFTGANARAADTFAGKMARLGAAFEQAQEAFGAGFVKGLDEANVSIEELQKSIVNLGEGLGNTAAAFTSFGMSVTDTMAGIRDNAATQAVLDIFEFLTRAGGFIVTGELQPSWDATAAKKAGDERRKAEISGRATLRQRNALFKAEKKITDERKKQLIESEKDKKNAEKLTKAKAMFDMEQIQIQAALQGKITEEERTRLLLMKAILEENGGEAERLTKKLQTLQEDTKKLAESLMDLEAGDPFGSWPSYFNNAEKLIVNLLSRLQGIQSNVNQMLSDAQKRSAEAAANVLSAKGDRTTAYTEAARATAVSAEIAMTDAIAAQAEAAAVLAAAQTPAEIDAATAFVEAANAAFDAATVLAESVPAAAEAAALAAANEANEYLQQSLDALAELGIFEPSIIINNYIEGNVTTESDLTETIVENLYQYQKTGYGLLYSPVAI